MSIQTYSTVKPNLDAVVLNSSGLPLKIPAVDASIGGTSFSNWAAWINKPTEVGALYGSAAPSLDDRPSDATSTSLRTKLVPGDDTPESTMHLSRDVHDTSK